MNNDEDEIMVMEVTDVSTNKYLVDLHDSKYGSTAAASP